MVPCAACVPLLWVASAESPCQSGSTSGCKDGCAVVLAAADIVVVAAAAVVVVAAAVDLHRFGCDCSETASGGPWGAGARAGVPSGCLAGSKGEADRRRRSCWARSWPELPVAPPVPPAPLVPRGTPLREVLRAQERTFVMTEIG